MFDWTEGFLDVMRRKTANCGELGRMNVQGRFAT